MSLWLICVFNMNTNLRRRYSPSILLYGLGLTLLLSLGFNGFLLYQQSHRQSMYEYDTARQADRDSLVLQQQLLECNWANQQKDSLIRYLRQAARTSPAREGIHRSSPK
jgi:hypothetical protein